MRRFSEIFKVAWRAHQSSFYDYVPRRTLKFQVNMKWVHPKMRPTYHPINSGDLVRMKYPNPNEVHYNYQNSKELADADEWVKKVFSFAYFSNNEALKYYEKQLVDKVKQNELDDSSPEVRIAKMTAKIRFFQSTVKRGKKFGNRRAYLKELVEIRKKKLKELRLIDYKRFEWLLEKLDLVYRPFAEDGRPIIRKKSLTLLIQLKMAKLKEEKVAKHQEKCDNEKVPFLEKKIEKLKWIQEMEKKKNLESTVKDEDIEECIKKLEKVKLDLAEKRKYGYDRKIHPYFIEAYNETLLREREKQGALKQSQSL